MRNSTSATQFSANTVSNINAVSQKNDAYALLNGGKTIINGTVNLETATDIGDAYPVSVGRYETDGFEFQRVGGSVTTDANSAVNIRELNRHRAERWGYWQRGAVG